MDPADSVFFVYILSCTDSKGKLTYYTGSTDNLMHRISLHSSGKGAKYTKGKKIELVHFERYPTRSEAMKREIEIKNMPLSKKKELFQSKPNEPIQKQKTE
jgi:putative endonuclease